MNKFGEASPAGTGNAGSEKFGFAQKKDQCRRMIARAGRLRTTQARIYKSRGEPVGASAACEFLLGANSRSERLCHVGWRKGMIRMKKFLALTATALILAGCSQSDRNGMGSSSGSQSGSDQTTTSSSGSAGSSGSSGAAISTNNATSGATASGSAFTGSR
jgi:hypothetical protein